MFVGEQKGLLKSMINDKLRLSKDVDGLQHPVYVKRYDYVLQERSLETFVKPLGMV
jgi:hypothetical protein